jgi:hypothetical protein
MFWNGISAIPDETANTAVTRSAMACLWVQGIPREDGNYFWVGQDTVLRVTAPYTDSR